MKIGYNNKEKYNPEEYPSGETIKKILKGLDEKRPESEILNLPATHRAEADKILRTIKLLKNAAGAVVPQRALLARIISAIGRVTASARESANGKATTVTNYPLNRYIFGEEKEKGRLFAFKISNMINLFIMNKQVIAGIGIFILVLGIGVVLKKSQRAPGGLPPVSIVDEELRQLGELMKDTNIEDLDSDSIESELAKLPEISSDSPTPSSSSKPVASSKPSAQPAENEAQLSKELADLQQLMGDTNFDMDEGLSALDTAL